ncbi:Aste57867_22406 [Aphanomyces stellatus]|uniref:Aste57867_22406 protein n=1 Tax=Aphanomyces stellatus TaxID=120398 RepID=A0A485LKR4_9STRA|nr:hypothetical protein As57867_022336 [Aphanomyces stellatus]VFT99069.1 Aste57867_22406 [Aphanomyces stellatus]
MAAPRPLSAMSVNDWGRSTGRTSGAVAASQDDVTVRPRVAKRKRAIPTSVEPLKRPQHLERDVAHSKVALEQAATAYEELNAQLHRDAAMFRVAHIAMRTQSKTASTSLPNKAKVVCMAAVNAAAEAAYTQTLPHHAHGKPLPHGAPLRMRPMSMPPSAVTVAPSLAPLSLPSSSSECHDPYFYLRPLQIDALASCTMEQLLLMLLSPADVQTLHGCIHRWLDRVLNTLAFPSAPDKDLDMSDAALHVHYLALAAHVLGAHAYASVQLESAFEKRSTPFLCRLDVDSIPSAYAALAAPLRASTRGVDFGRGTSALVRSTLQSCPDILWQVMLWHSNDDDESDQGMSEPYVKHVDEARFLEQFMWLRKLVDHAGDDLQLVTNGIKAIARIILSIHRRQLLHRWHLVLHDTLPRHGTRHLHPAMGFLARALEPPRGDVPAVAPPCPILHRSSWLRTYVETFTLGNAVQHLLPPHTKSHVHRQGELLQLGHYVLLDEAVNPAGAEAMLDVLHVTRQDLAGYDRALAWHVYATQLLADHTSVVFKHPVADASPSLNTIQERLQALASELRHSEQHHAATKWIGLAIEQLSCQQGGTGEPANVGMARDEFEGLHPEESTPPATMNPPSAVGGGGVIDLTLDDDPSETEDENDDENEDRRDKAIRLDTEDDDHFADERPIVPPTRVDGHVATSVEVAAESAARVSAEHRMYLTCSVLERRMARELGAEYDPEFKQWFVPAGMDLAPFARWAPQPKPVESLPEPSSPPRSAPRTSTERMYVDCPYIERGQAKGLGALWDVEKKQWYVPPGLDLRPFLRWTPRAPQVSTVRMYLDCPYPQNFLVKGLGAHWDPDTKSWFVPPGLDLARFTRWLPPSSSEEPVAADDEPMETPDPQLPVDPPLVTKATRPVAPVSVGSDKPQARKITPLPAKRRNVSAAAIHSSCHRVLVDLVGSVEQTVGCSGCKFHVVYACVQCKQCRAHCRCYVRARERDDLRSEQESMFEAARRRARLLKQTVAGPLPDYTSCVTGPELLSTPRILAMWRDANAFGVLGVPPSASVALIKRQYRTMVLQLHPDKSKHDTPDKVSAFMAVTNAFRQVKMQLNIH